MNTLSRTQPKYRDRLPQLDGRRVLSCGGLETTLIFHEGWDLPAFASFVLVETERGRERLRAYFDRYIDIAERHGTGFLLETPTWRANPEWGATLGYDLDGLERVNRELVALAMDIRDRRETPTMPMPLSGNIGPRGDGYDPRAATSAQEAADYHSWQIGVLKDAGADLVSAFTISSSAEGLGIALAAKKADMPCVISFTLETDGRLPTGEHLGEVITAIDIETGNAPAYYMINCAHPTHFEGMLREGGAWTRRLGGLRANSSRRSHAELDNATELDIGNPAELGGEYAEILERFPHINVLGGCCGTDERHVAAIGAHCCGGAAA